MHYLLIVSQLNTVRHKRAWYIINGITLYRTLAAPVLGLMLYTGRYEAFKWLLLVSFFTDFIDGFLARRYKVTSVMGTRLDSLGDDLTVLAGITGLIVIYPEFIRAEKWWFIALLLLFFIQLGFALYRYGKMTNFHTYLAKAAAILQGLFLLLAFFLYKPLLPLFYAAAVVTLAELAEEIVLVRLLPKWKTDIRGFYWVWKEKSKKQRAYSHSGED